MKFNYEFWKVVKKLEQIMRASSKQSVYVAIIAQVIAKLLIRLIKHITGY